MTTISNSRPKGLRGACGLLCLISILLVRIAVNGFAAPPNPAGQHAPGESSAKSASTSADDTGHDATAKETRVPESLKASPVHTSHSPNSLTAHPQPVVNPRPRAGLGNSRNLEPIRSDKIGVMTRPAESSSAPGLRVAPVQTVSAARPLAPLHTTVPHRSPNPAVVSGSSNLHRGQTGAVSGSGMIRKR